MIVDKWEARLIHNRTKKKRCLIDDQQESRRSEDEGQRGQETKTGVSDNISAEARVDEY